MFDAWNFATTLRNRGGPPSLNFLSRLIQLWDPKLWSYYFGGSIGRTLLRDPHKGTLGFPMITSTVVPEGFSLTRAPRGPIVSISPLSLRSLVHSKTWVSKTSSRDTKNWKSSLCLSTVTSRNDTEGLWVRSRVPDNEVFRCTLTSQNTVIFHFFFLFLFFETVY